MDQKASETSYLKFIVASNVRRLRNSCGMSQEQLADVCGYHRTYIGAVERAERNITLATLAAIAIALNIEPEKLLIDCD